MISNRSSRITRRTKQHEYYSDFTRGFLLNPVTGALERLTNTDAVKQSIENLVMTRRGDRFYHLNIGSDVQKSMFDNFDDLTASSIEQSIATVIQQNEPRAQNVGIQVLPDIANNLYTVNIQFTVINIPNIVQEMTIIINRVR